MKLNSMKKITSSLAALVGFVLIIIFWGVVNLIAGSTGFSAQTITNVPAVTVPTT